MAKPSSRT